MKFKIKDHYPKYMYKVMYYIPCLVNVAHLPGPVLGTNKLFLSPSQ